MNLFKKKITRRAMIQDAGLVAGAGLLGLASNEIAHSQAAAGRSGSARALVLCSDRSHNADEIHMALGRLFKELNMPVDFTIEYEKLSAKLLSNYQ